MNQNRTPAVTRHSPPEVLAEMDRRMGFASTRTDKLGETMQRAFSAAKNADIKLPDNPTIADIEKALRDLIARGEDWAKEFLDAIEKAKKDVEEGGAPKAAASRDRSSPEVVAELDRRMGLTKPHKSPVRREGRDLILGVMTPEQARAHRAAKGV